MSLALTPFDGGHGFLDVIGTGKYNFPYIHLIVVGKLRSPLILEKEKNPVSEENLVVSMASDAVYLLVMSQDCI